MLQGIFASNQGVVGDRLGDFSSAVLKMQPTGTSPFLALSSGMKKANAGDTVFNWNEDSHQAMRSTLTAGGTGTGLTVADGSFFLPGNVCLVEETGEHVFVTATNGNGLTVIRGMGGTAVTSISNGMNLQQIGNANEEGSGMPVAKMQQGHPRLNYTQIFRNSWAITGTAKVINFRTGNKSASNKRDCASFHAEDMERAFLWGRKHIGTFNNKQFRLTDGVTTQIAGYGGTVLSAASAAPGGSSTPGQLSRVDFEDFIRSVFAINVKGEPNERIALGGDQVLAVLNQMTMLDGTYQISAGEKVLGINVTKIQTAFGSLNLMTHPLMNENPVWRKELYVMHPGAIRKRVLRETFEDNFDSNGNHTAGIDADQGVMTTEVGIEVGAARTMGILKNVNKAVKSS